MLDKIKKEILPNAAEFRDSDWKKVFDVMHEIFMYSERARREGILALEDGLYELDKGLQYFFNLVMYGVGAERIEDYAENIFNVASLDKLNAFLLLVYACGALCIQAGFSEDEIAAQFETLVPSSRKDEFSVMLESNYGSKKAIIGKAIAWNNLGDIIKITPTEDLFSKSMVEASDYELKILFRYGYYFGTDGDLEKALKYSTYDVIKRVLEDEDIESAISFIRCINDMLITKKDSDYAKGKILAALSNVRRMANMASEGKAVEAFELGLIADDFSKAMDALSDSQIRTLAEKAEESDLQNIFNCTKSEVINRFAANMDFDKLFSVCECLNRKYANESMERILAMTKEIK